MSDYIIDKLKERTTGKILYPETLFESIKFSEEEESKNLKEIFEGNNLLLDYELYSFRVNLADSNPQTRISYFDMAKGKRPAFWNYTNGYFDYGDWSNAFFIKNMFPCMVKYDGTVDYRLDSENYLLKEESGSSDVSNSLYAGSAMVAFPTIWIKRWNDDSFLYCSISNKQLDEDYHAYMHTDPNGKVCLYKYIGMYFSTLFTDRYKSLAGQTFTANRSFDDELAYTHANGDRWEVFSWSDFITISDLITLITKSDDSQKSLGYGAVNTTKKTSSDPASLNNGGMFINDAALGITSNQKIFHIHNLYDNQYTRMGGLIYLNGSLFVKPYPPYSSTSTESYIEVGVKYSGTSDTYISKSMVNEYGRFPISLGGKAGAYECDSVAFANAITGIGKTRGAYNSKDKAGKLGLKLDNTSAADQNTVSRLTCFSVDPM